MRAFIGVMAILLFGGCITTFQTAEVLPEGESVVGLGASIPVLVGETIPELFLEAFYRRGIGYQMDIGLKGGYLDILNMASLNGEVKYQFSPLPVAVMLGAGGYLIEGEISPILLYPTLLASYRGAYGGARVLIPVHRDLDPDDLDIGFVAGFAWRPLKGRMTVYPEITTSFDELRYASLGLQWDLGGKGVVTSAK